MRVFPILAFALSALYAQTVPPRPKTIVTVTGCVRKGVECLRLVDPQDPGKLLYSITGTSRLKVGHAYEITGPLKDIGFCMEGKPILAPEKITELTLDCGK